MGVKVRKIKGSWYIVINYRGRRKSKKIGTREAAEEVRRKVEAMLALGDMGIFDDPEAKAAPILEEYAERWLQTHIRVRFKPATFFSYRASLATHVFPYLGKRHLDRITPADIENLVYQLATQAEPPAQGTIRLMLSVLRSLLAHARKAKVIATNPASGLGELSRSNKPERKGQAMTKREVSAFLAAVEALFPEMWAFFFTALRTGMRRGELAALRWGDLNFGESEDDPNRFFLVQQNYVYRSFGTPKSGHGRRVDMSKQLRAVLLARRDEAMLAAMMAGKTSIADDLVFPGTNGKPLVVDALMRRYFEPALARAGLRKFTIHDLRHTYATMMIQAGASLAYVQKQLGHSSISITVDTYGHLQPGENIAWADRMDAATQQENATQAQTPEMQACEKSGEDVEVEAVTIGTPGALLTTPPCTCARVRPLPS